MKNMYNYLGWAAMLSVPLAPAFFFGFEFFKDVYGQIYAWTPNVWVAAIPSLIIGLVSAAGLEFVGILSGHNAIRFWERKELNQAVICAIILVSYVALGIVGLENIWTKGVVMFLVAPLVYVLIGMQGQLDKVESKEAELETEDRQDERELKRLRLQLAHEEKMAKIQASIKPAQSVTEVKERAEVKTDSQTLLDTSRTDWRTLSDSDRSQIARLTPEQIISQFGVSSKTAGRWLQKSGQLQPELSTNGHSNGVHK